MAVWLSFLCLAGADASLTPGRFAFFMTVTPPAGATGDVAVVTLPAAVYARCDALPHALRLFNGDKREVPFRWALRTTERTASVDTEWSAVAMSLRELPGNALEVTVRRDLSNPVPALIRFRTLQHNFEKQVTVSGSRDGTTWTLIGGPAPIYDYARYLDVRQDRVALAAGDYEWFKILLENIAEYRNSPIQTLIQNTGAAGEKSRTEIQTWQRELFRVDRILFVERQERLLPGEPDLADDPLPRRTLTQAAEPKRTVLSIETGRRPLRGVCLQTPSVNFSRAVTVEAAEDALANAWSPLGHGTVHRIHVGSVREEQLWIPFERETRAQHIRILIENADNPPLNITGMVGRASVYTLAFFPETGGGYKLFYGAERLAPPTYDVARVLKADPWHVGTPWELGAEAVNPGYQTDRFRFGDGKTLLKAVLLLMAALLLVIVARMVRKLRLMPGKRDGEG